MLKEKNNKIKEQPKKVEIGTVKRHDTSENQVKIVFLGIGSNLGLRKTNIEKAKFLLAQYNLDFISVSSYYETPSWPDPNKPRFINIVLKVTCEYKPLELLNLCKNVEKKTRKKKSY